MKGPEGGSASLFVANWAHGHEYLSLQDGLEYLRYLFFYFFGKTGCIALTSWVTSKCNVSTQASQKTSGVIIWLENDQAIF